MVFSLARLFLLSLSATSVLARLPSHARTVRDALPVSGVANPTKPAKDDALAIAAQPSPMCPSPRQTGYISVTSDADKSLNGYVAARPNPFGIYGLATDIQSAIHVSFCPDDASGNRAFNIYVAPPDDTSDSDFPCLGAVQEEASYPPGDLRPDSTVPNYAGLARTPEIASGPAVLTNSSVIPREVALKYGESRIWTTDPQAVPMPLIPVWTNRDGTSFSYSWIHDRGNHEGGSFGFGWRRVNTIAIPVNFTFVPATGSEA